MSKQLHSRRSALKSIAAIASVQIVPSRILWGAQTPSNTLTKGIIGCGGICSNHLRRPGKLLALCDVDKKRLASRMQDARENYASPDVKGYHDFRDLIARKDIDIVHVATPPHWHALMSIAAAKAGKDVWCEKPMSRTIGEGLAMVAAVEKQQCIFRLNTWFRFKGGYYGLRRPAVDAWKAVQHGLLGDNITFNLGSAFVGNWKLKQWSGRPGLKGKPVPEELDYEFWLGPAPMKPYNPARVHGRFRGYWDYDGGGLGDMGQHYLDPAQFILGKDAESPVEIEADTQKQDIDAVLPWRRIEMKYADGTKIILDDANDPDAPIISGSKGNIFRGFRSDIQNLDKKLEQLPSPPEMVTDFHQAVRERKKFALNESNGFRSCTIVNLGKIALRTGRKLRFDSDKLMFPGDEEANKYVNQPMRAPWKL